MAARVLLLVGTKKGAFILESDAERRDWLLRGPLCSGWPISYMSHDPATGTIYAAGGNAWYGPAVWRSPDLGRTWTHSSAGITYGDGGPSIDALWTVEPANGAVYLGVAPAGLFRSDDRGQTWEQVAGLRAHPTAPQWQAGAGGLCLHTIVPHPDDPDQMWVAISAAGAYYTADGGRTWEPRNRGVRAEFREDKYPEFGQCVHRMVMAPGRPERLYQQNHCGVYRTDDGGRQWTEVSRGLPTDFGFPFAVHPRDPEKVYVIPLTTPEAGRHAPGGSLAVWRSSDGGDSWTRQSRGLPQENAYVGVLRHGLAVDSLSPAGVYFATSTGQVFGSSDEGESWSLLADYLPNTVSIAAVVVED